MRRLLLSALVIALLVGASVGVASARFADGGSGSQERPAAPYRVPAGMPAADGEQAGTWGYRSSLEIGAQIEREAGVTPTRSSASAPAGGAAATVTVTATVLPVVILVVDDGRLVELVTNTADRDARDVLFIVREGTVEGTHGALDPATWDQAEDALTEATAGTGTVWQA